MNDTGAPLSPEALFGAVMRAYRKGGLRETAARLPINFSHLAKWERGERPVPAEMVAALDRAYGANGALITLHELITRDRLRSTALAAPIGWGTPCPAHSSGQGDPYWQKERSLLAATAASDAALPEEALAAIEELAIGVRTAVIERDGIDVERWERLAQERALAYHTGRPGALLGQLVVDFGRLSRLLGRNLASAATQTGLLGTAARLASLLAVEYGDLGEQTAADRCWELARDAADAAGERTLRVWVRGREACHALWTARPVVSVTRLIANAMAIAEGKPCAGLALAYAAGAHLAANRGDAGGTRTALGEFLALADRLPDQTADETALAGGLPLWAQTSHLIYPNLLIGDTDEAARALEQASTLCPDGFHGQAATLDLYRACLSITTGEVGHGLELAASAAQSWPPSTMRRHITTHLLATLPEEARTHPAARELHNLIIPLIPFEKGRPLSGLREQV